MNQFNVSTEKLFESGALIITGGRDKYGNHVICLPVAKLETVENLEMEPKHLAAVLQKYLNWLNLIFNTNPGAALVVNLKHTRKLVIEYIVEAMHIIESKKKSILQVVYIVKPDSIVKAHLLKKLLGLKQPQDLQQTRNVEVQLIKSVDLLRSVIQPSQITRDYGGSLYHHHDAWFYFYKRVMPCIQCARDLKTKLPGIKERVELLEDYETSDQTSTQLQQTLMHIADQYESVIKESNLHEILEQCKQMLHQLESSDGTYDVTDVDPSLTSPAILMLRQLYQDLSQFRQQCSVYYKSVVNNVASSQHLQVCKEKSDKIISDIRQLYLPKLMDHPLIGETQSQAEIHRKHFISSVYDPAKNIIGEATDVLEELRLKCKDGEKVRMINNNLTTAIETFTARLQKLYDDYTTIHVFHVLLEKFLKWYKKVLVFLPDYLSSIEEDAPDKLVYMPEEWTHAVGVFLSKHPAPREEHIGKLDVEIPPALPKHIKKQANTLALRTRLLKRLVTSRRLPVKLITASIKWKDEIFKPSLPSKPRIRISTESISTTSAAETNPPKSPKDRTKSKQAQQRRKSYPQENVRSTQTDPIEDVPEKQGKQVQVEPKTSEEPERFIRLTFTPKEPAKDKIRFAFDEEAEQEGSDSESGVEMFDVNDPYDVIIDKIKQVSNSGISSDMKLKYVTNLLQHSLTSSNQRKHQIPDNAGQSRHAKTATKYKRHSKPKPFGRKSMENISELGNEPSMKAYQSLVNLAELHLHDEDSDASLPRFYNTSMRPTRSMHSLYDELTPPKDEKRSQAKWYEDYDAASGNDLLNDEAGAATEVDPIEVLRERHKRLLEKFDEMEAEMQNQTYVENSLRRSANILQEEEMRRESEYSGDIDWENVSQVPFEDLMPQLSVRHRNESGFCSGSTPTVDSSQNPGSAKPILSTKTSLDVEEFSPEGYAVGPPGDVGQPKRISHREDPLAMRPEDPERFSKASEALASLLPRFSNTQEVDEFCSQLKERRLRTEQLLRQDSGLY